MLAGEEESSVRLSNQASRLLHEMVINCGSVLERDYLIEKVWEEYGYTGSSISLNVAVSEIRKVFRSLGFEAGLIKTIRGRGFCLQCEVTPDMVPIDVGNSESTNHTVTNLLINNKLIKLPQSKNRNKVIFCFLILTLIGCALFLVNKRDEDFTSNSSLRDIHNVGNIGTCTFYLIDKNMYKPVAYYFDLIKSEVDALKVDCKHRSVDVYYSQFIQKRYSSSVISVCYVAINEKKYKNCSLFKKIKNG